jgi:prepilin-type N-terminal cleavage/methylation domain-containing protein
MKRGFTLIELLIATAIFTMVVIAFISIFIAVAGVQARQTSVAAVNEESQVLLQKVQYYVELSSSVSSTVDASSSVLTLRMPSSSIDPTTLSLASGTVYIVQGVGGTPQPLTSGRVNVSTLAFTRHANTPGHDSVDVSFTMTYNTSNIAQMFSQALQTSVARVSAATFDSSVLPATSGSLNLGATGQTWNSINGIIYFSGTNVGINAASPQTALEVNGGVRLNPSGSLTCAGNSNARGTLWFTTGGTGKDSLQVCAQNASGTLGWQTLY